jgi:3-oxoacyl-[acyl-carrier protein] reductase
MIDLNLEGRKAIVTGASLGIGAAVSRELADMGAEVFCCARDSVSLDRLSSHSENITGRAADLGGKTGTREFLSEVKKLTDGVDIIVNNVGASPSRNFLYMEDEDWEDLHQLNLMSAVRCTREFLPYMREKKWGRVIMVASSAAKYPSAALIDYGATKAALISLSKSLARKYGRDGVLVNSVLPGLIHTAMWERAAGEIATANNSTVDEVIRKNGRTVPVGRYGTSEEVSSLVAFLCTNSASYINGTSIEVDGGSAGHI